MRKIYALFIIILLYSYPCISQGIYQVWGMTQVGGDYNAGTMFSTTGSGDHFNLRHHFNILNPGGNPQLTELAEYNGKFYGVTASGGNNQSGVIFEWDPASNVYNKKFDFIDSAGSGPMGGLLLYAGKFYGVTEFGGEGAGVIFEWDPATNNYTKRFAFTVVDDNGYWPKGHLALNDGKIYGMTGKGGTFDKGVIFEWDPAANVYTKKIDFNGSNGSEPFGNLVMASGNFYGMTPTGGNNDLGVIFEWNPTTNVFTKKIDFDGNLGSNPYGSLTAYNGKFYGLTQRGNPGDGGVLFEWNPSTNQFVKKHDFSDATGVGPSANLVMSAGKFYSTTGRGGLNDMGVIFEWDPTTNAYNKSVDFSKTAGNYPNGNLTLKGGKFYGMTPLGGKTNEGVIFEWDPVANVYQKKIDLDDYTNGVAPTGNLVVKDGKWYGMTNAGGSNDLGVIFEYDPSSDTYTKKFDFATATGSKPLGSLSYCGNKFYGMTAQGGINDGGVIFEWDLSSNTFTKKIDLEYATGSKPVGSLVLNGGKCYGMTYEGGDMGSGVIFEYDPATNVYTKKIDLGSANGFAPTGNLTFANGKFYGMTYKGGSNFSGVIFEWDPATNIYSKKFDFNTTAGKSPAGSLSLFNGKLYGLTTIGGSNNLGVIFEYDPATGVYTKKVDFTNSIDGNRAYGNLTLSGNKFYGMTRFGGSNFGGVVFEWDPVTNIYTRKQDLDGTSTGSFPGVVNNLSSLPAPVAKGNSNSCASFAPVTIDNTNNNVWVPIIDAKGDAVAEIRANGNNLGVVTASIYINNGTVREDASKKLYLDRNITITAAVQPTSAVDIRLYIKHSEYLALKNAFNSNGQSSNINSINEVGIFKNGDSCSASVVRNTVPLTSAAAAWEADHVLTASTNSFSSFYFYSLVQGGPLPLTTLEFNGRLVNNNAELNWETNDEINIGVFDLERSTNGTSYTNINKAAASNQPGVHHYFYTDEQISSLGVPVIYYRLKQTDLDGKYRYSGVVTIGIRNSNMVLLYPNPVISQANINISAAKADMVNMRLIDNTGRVLKQAKWNILAGINSISLNVAGLANGIYYIELNGESIKERKRFIKQ